MLNVSSQWLAIWRIFRSGTTVSTTSTQVFDHDSSDDELLDLTVGYCGPADWWDNYIGTTGRFHFQIWEKH